MSAVLIAILAVVVVVIAIAVIVVVRRRGAQQAGTIAAPSSAPPVPPREAVPPIAPPRKAPPAAPAEVAEPGAGEPGAEAPEAPEPEVEALEAPPRLRDRLGRARGFFAEYLGAVVSRASVDGQSWADLEEGLIRADVGVGTTIAILENLRARAKSEKITEPDALVSALKDELAAVFAGGDRTLAVADGTTTIWLFVGVNGVGKTTTIGKVAAAQSSAGRRVVVAAGDTFRAAAVEQLEQWAKRAGASIVRGNEGGDPSAVVFDAVQSATARGSDLVLADTAGRLHTKVNLMEELKKVRRVAEKTDAAVSEVLLVIDATTGQNGLVQAKEFAGAVGVTGVVLTKLDGTAKGGIAVAIEKDLGIPIKLVGLGEGPGDLAAFDPAEFVDALVGG